MRLYLTMHIMGRDIVIHKINLITLYYMKKYLFTRGPMQFLSNRFFHKCRPFIKTAITAFLQNMKGITPTIYPLYKDSVVSVEEQ